MNSSFVAREAWFANEFPVRLVSTRFPRDVSPLTFHVSRGFHVSRFMFYISRFPFHLSPFTGHS